MQVLSLMHKIHKVHWLGLILRTYPSVNASVDQYVLSETSFSAGTLSKWRTKTAAEVKEMLCGNNGKIFTFCMIMSTRVAIMCVLYLFTELIRFIVHSACDSGISKHLFHNVDEFN